MQVTEPRISFKLLSAAFLSITVLLSACNKQPKLNLERSGQLPAPETKELDAEGLVRMAQRMETSGDLTNAMNFYADALIRDGSLVDAHLGMARVMTALGDPAQALTYYGHAARLSPNDAGIARHYALALIGEDRADEAATVIDGYLAGNTGTGDLYNILGVARDLQSQHDTAQAAYREGLALVTVPDRQHVNLLNNLALSLAISDKYSEAVLLLNPYIGDMRLGPDAMTEHQSLYRQNLALVYAISGQTESAVDVAKSALSEQQAEFNRRFYETIPTLSGSERTRAVFLRELPDSTS